MTAEFSSFRLNDLLIEIGRSLAQYAGQGWPWVPFESDEEKTVVDRLVAGQQESAARLAELLAFRGHRIDFGTFPTEYTSLHYMALDYLLDRLIADQQTIVADFDSAAAQAAGDPQAGPLLREIADRERRNLEDLQSLLSRRTAGQPA